MATATIPRLWSVLFCVIVMRCIYTKLHLSHFVRFCLCFSKILLFLVNNLLSCLEGMVRDFQLVSKDFNQLNKILQPLYHKHHKNNQFSLLHCYK